MKRVVTLGEILLRLTPPGHQRFVQARQFNAIYGGSEANVATILASLNTEVSLVSRVPDNEIGNASINALRRYGIDTRHILRGGDRMGIYFLEDGASVRPSRVIYDRTDSAFSTLRPGMIDWDEIFNNADWFHWSGIVPALSVQSAEICMEAIQAASTKGLTISCDLNYRKNLWKYGPKATDIMPEMVAQSDVIVGAMNEYTATLGLASIPFRATDSDYQLDRQAYLNECQMIDALYPHCKKLFILQRNSLTTNHDIYTAVLYTEGKLYQAPIYDIEPVTDKVGVGDAFAGAMIYSLRAFPKDNDYVLRFSLAASALKNTVYGDSDLISTKEVEELLNGNVSGRVQR